MRIFAAVLLALTSLTNAVLAEPQHGISIYGDLKYKPDFTHFDYVNPNAPKGGEARYSALGGFDNLNPFIVKGQAAAGSSLPFETLMTPAADEASSEYGLIAESIETPPDRSWVIFNLRKEARFHDGSPILADDVIFSFDTLKNKGLPFYRAYFQSVEKVEKLDERKVRFTFVPGENRELPVILGQMPVLSKAYWKERAFDQTTLEAPMGSGPYKIERIDPNRSITLARAPDYWGKDLPVNKGLYNFDRIRYDYYRDSTVALEAFKAGLYDIRAENESKKWATGYDFPAISSGKAKAVAFLHHRPTGMQGFVFNMRRPIWQNRDVRRALAFAFNFEWTNKTLFHGQYTRTTSYFSNSDLAASGLPSESELTVLEPLLDQLPKEVFTQEYLVPVNDSDGAVRANLRIAAQMLEDAGYKIKDGKLTDPTTGKPFTFEILLDQPIWERITLPFVDNLKRLGITATVRTIDSAQYEERLKNFDFDMIVDVWGQSETPGNEQRSFWGSEAADQSGARNSIGVKNPAIDQLIEQLIASPDRETLVARTRALDRALLWNHYVIPHWHYTADRIAFWNKFGMPETLPYNGVQLSSWWSLDAEARPAKPAGVAK